jgi:hypothetical protein
MKVNLIHCILASVLSILLVLSGCQSRGSITTSTSNTWETHTYSNDEAGFSLSFDTPSNWQPTGPIGNLKIGGWYDPNFPKPPDEAAVWCYWITSTYLAAEVDDPIVLLPSQKRIATYKIQGNWSYHLMCISPLETFEQQENVFNQIMASLKPVQLDTK